MFNRYRFLTSFLSKIGNALSWILGDKFRIMGALFVLLFINYLHVRGMKTRLQLEVEQKQGEIEVLKQRIPELQRILKIQLDSLRLQKNNIQKLDLKSGLDDQMLARKDSALDMKDGQITQIQITLKKVLDREKSKDRQLANAKAALSSCLQFDKPPNPKSNAS